MLAITEIQVLVKRVSDNHASLPVALVGVESV